MLFNKPLPKWLQHCFVALTLCLSSQHSLSAVVLQYHHVDEATPASTSISPALFNAHLEYIAEQNYRVWRLKDIVTHLQNKEPIPDKVVAITFDDAYDSIYHAAYPLLKSRNWPFTVFVSTQPIVQKLPKFMSWEQLKEMSKHGATIANHTHTHLHMVRKSEEETKTEWLKRLEGEIQLSANLLKEHLQQTNRLFAYPFGEYTGEIQNMIRELGYSAFGQQSGAIGQNSDLSALPRFPMTNRYGAMPQFKLKLGSLPFTAASVTPDLEILKANELKEGLTIEFEEVRGSVNCFFAGEPLPLEQKKNTIKIAHIPEFPAGRSRINCTATANERGRYYWFSKTWMKLNPDGSWYPEQ